MSKWTFSYYSSRSRLAVIQLWRMMRTEGSQNYQ